MVYPAVSILSQNSSRKVRKLLARAYLREYRVGEAVDVYLALLRDYPADVDALIVLGNLYRIAGNPKAAEHLYLRAQEICPAHLLANEQLKAPAVPSTWDDDTPLAPVTLARLEERLVDHASLEVPQAVREAADMLDRLASAERASRPLGKIPADLQQLMPVLIEQTLRQARQEGMADLVEALQSLQFNLTHRAGDDWPVDAPVASDPAGTGSLTGL